MSRSGGGFAEPRPGRVVEFGRTSSFKLAVCSASSSNAEVSAERRLPESLLKGSAIVTTPPSRTTVGMMWFGFSVPAVGAGAEGDATVRLGG